LTFDDLVNHRGEDWLSPIIRTPPFPEILTLLEITKELLSHETSRLRILYSQLLVCPACDVSDCVGNQRYFTPCLVDEELLQAMLEEARAMEADCSGAEAGNQEQTRSCRH